VRLLFDENLSESLLPALADLFPNSLHVRTLGSGGAADHVVWDLARQHGCLLVTRDEDFIRLSVARGAPPKVIWIALGNCSNAAVVALLRGHHTELARFVEHEEATFLALGSDPGAG
jgi:predicted nuclease of predicted toxin-antitoxin system